MICYSPVTTCSMNAIHIKRQLGSHLYSVVSQGSYKFRCYSHFSGVSKCNYTHSGVSVTSRAFRLADKGHYRSVLINPSTQGKLEVSFLKCSENKSNMRNLYWCSRLYHTSLIASLLVCYSSSSQSAYAEADNNNHVCNNSSDGKFHNGKRVYTDYSIIGIPGDGRCLFRYVAHGFCLCSGKPPPNVNIQKELADELRSRLSRILVDEASVINMIVHAIWVITKEFNAVNKNSEVESRMGSSLKSWI